MTIKTIIILSYPILSYPLSCLLSHLISDQEALQTINPALISLHMDYFKVFYIKLLLKSTWKLQFFWNTVAYVVMSMLKYGYITLLFHEQHWLPFRCNSRCWLLFINPFMAYSLSEWLPIFDNFCPSCLKWQSCQSDEVIIWWDLKSGVSLFLCRPSGSAIFKKFVKILPCLCLKCL